MMFERAPDEPFAAYFQRLERHAARAALLAATGAALLVGYTAAKLFRLVLG